MFGSNRRIWVKSIFQEKTICQTLEVCMSQLSPALPYPQAAAVLWWWWWRLSRRLSVELLLSCETCAASPRGELFRPRFLASGHSESWTVIINTSGGSRGTHPSPLTFIPNWGPQVRKKKFLLRPLPAPYLRVWMKAPPPPPLSEGLDSPLNTGNLRTPIGCLSN